MHDEQGRGVPRRRLLKALALAPAAVAGCAAARAERSTSIGSISTEEGGSSPSPGRGPAAGTAGAVAAVRSFPVPAEAEPAFVFRAAATRPGEP